MSMTDPLAPQEPQRDTLRDAGAVAPLRRDDFDRDVWCLMGLAVDAADITRAMAEIDDAARTGRKLSFVTPNVNFLVRAAADPAARREILNADLSLVDGAPLVMMAKLLGVPVPSRVAGSDLFEALRRRPGFAGRRLKVFFFGGRDGAAEAAAEALNRERGGLEAVGWLNPGFGDVDAMSSDAVIDEINAAEADFIVVALGAAKGQAWIDRNQGRLTAPVMSHLGAVVDFTAGGVARAPQWVARAGLEWAWRIKEEPSLWKRYYKDGLGLARLVLTGLAPQLGRRRLDAAGEAGADLEAAPAETIIRLSGDLGHRNLAPVREAFRAAAARGKSVRLDFSGAGRVDRAFLGQLLMLEKHLGRAGAQIRISGANRNVAALLAANRMRYAPAQAADVSGADAATARKAAV
ncbi:WecB/TagA/CpsF family glycosyltransferase [Hyphococcus luteus]|nr:WecB/TagA/CpsF family glycosyltransferase [Marinicaulis flavus]